MSPCCKVFKSTVRLCAVLWKCKKSNREKDIMLLIMFNHHTLKKVKLHYLHMGALCFLSALQNAVPYRRLSPARVCVTLRKLSFCRELRPALLSARLQTARLFPDPCDWTTCSCLHDRCKCLLSATPTAGGAWSGANVHDNVSVHFYVCVLTSALIHVSLHLLMSSAGRNTIGAENYWFVAKVSH